MISQLVAAQLTQNMQLAHSAQSYRQVRQLEIKIENKCRVEDRAQEKQQREDEKLHHIVLNTLY